MNNTFITIVALSITSSLSLVACGGEEPTEETATTEAPNAEAAETNSEAAEEPAAEEPTISADALPVAEDFEEEVETSVTAENYQAQLNELLGELGPEEGAAAE